MAGGKETPRQKMIGMMYLVLTALLALQVSSAVMEKFILLDQSLKGSALKVELENDAIVGRIAKKVAERGNKEREKKLLEDAKKVKELTHSIIDNYLEEDVRETFVMKFAGGWKEGQKGLVPVASKDTEPSNQFFIGVQGKKNGKAYEMENKLNNYVAEIEKIAQKYDKSIQIGKIAIPAKEHPVFKNDPEQKRKDFAKLMFEDSPVVAALATVSELEAKVVKAEGDVLNALAAQVGAADFKFDAIVPMYRAESSVVAAGTKYKADMFISATSSTIKPEMKFGNKKISVDENGIGQIQFTASAGKYNKEGRAEKTWKGEITIPSPTGGGDTTFIVTGEYVVAKPVIQIQSASVQALYYNCGNELNVQVPALGSQYSPRFSASGGDVIAGKKKGEVTVVPTSKKQVALTVSSGGNKIGTESFKVRGIPKPEIVAYAKGKPVDQKRGMSAAAAPRSISVKAIPDESFRAFLPKDARYKVTKWEVMLVRGKRPVNVQTVTSETANISQFASAARPGDRILIEVKDVKRMNFRNRIEDVQIGTVIMNIPLHD